MVRKYVHLIKRRKQISILSSSTIKSNVRFHVYKNKYFYHDNCTFFTGILLLNIIWKLENAGNKNKCLLILKLIKTLYYILFWRKLLCRKRWAKRPGIRTWYTPINSCYRYEIIWAIVARYSGYSSKARDLDFNVKFTNFERLCDTNDTNLLTESGL